MLLSTLRTTYLQVPNIIDPQHFKLQYPVIDVHIIGFNKKRDPLQTVCFVYSWDVSIGKHHGYYKSIDKYYTITRFWVQEQTIYRALCGICSFAQVRRYSSLKRAKALVYNKVFDALLSVYVIGNTMEDYIGVILNLPKRVAEKDTVWD